MTFQPDDTLKDDTVKESGEESDPFVGSVLNDRYRVERKLGAGGHGFVYAGKQLGNERKVAIKLLRPESIEDDELEGRFRREGLVMCSLKSAHTITTYDVDTTDDGTMYIVMELLEGRTLSDLLRKEAPLASSRVLRLVSQMCEALVEAHGHGIVHRDLKPANIILEERPGSREFVKILDFGIAKILAGEPLGMSTIPKLTARGETIGTLFYMSPEQLLGARLDGRSDIYALGVLTYQMLTRRLPFPDARKPANLLAAQLRKAPEAPSVALPGAGIPPEVDAMVLRMLAKETELRYESAEQVLQVCQAILAGGSMVDIDVAAHVEEDLGETEKMSRDSFAPSASAQSGFSSAVGMPTPGASGAWDGMSGSMDEASQRTELVSAQSIDALGNVLGDPMASGSSRPGRWLPVVLLALAAVAGIAIAALAL